MWPASSQQGLLRCWGQAGGGGGRKGRKISLGCQVGLKELLSWRDLLSVACLALPRSPLLARRFVEHGLVDQA